MISLLDVPGLRKLCVSEPAFASALAAMAEGLGLDPSYLAVVMSLESGLDPHIQNSISATGLIQFTIPTAKGLGTTVDMLRQMTAVQQLEYVRRFFAPHQHSIRPNQPGDYYMTVFMPGYLGMPRDFVLGEKDSTEILPKVGASKGKIFEQNTFKGQIGTGLDVNGDGKITVGDVMAKAENLAASASTRPRLEVAEVPLAPSSSPPVPRPRPVMPSASPSLPPAWRSSGGPFDLPVLRIGAKGTAVALAQLLLGSDVITGVYTEAMALDYVRPFQEAHGLGNDAVIGPQTWESLAESFKDRPTEIPPA